MNIHFPQPIAATSTRDNEPKSDPLSCFLAKTRLCEFFDNECEEIAARLFDSTAKVDRDEHFLRGGDQSSAIFMLCSGWAVRYAYLPDGRRQIVELLLPGDMFRGHAMTGGNAGEGIVALNTCVAAICSPVALEHAILSHPNFGRLVWWLTQRDMGVLRAWVANIGQRNSYARFAHLICEISARLSQAGMPHDGGFEMPLTQEDLADMSGITSVHANRVLRQLGLAGLFQLRHRRARILDQPGLEQAAGFDRGYLTPC